MRGLRSCALAVFAIFAAAGAFADSTPPVITPEVTGTEGGGGWYVSDVILNWSVVDAESTILSTTGCDPALVAVDTTGNLYTCSAASAGGTTTASVLVKRDATPPVIDLAGAQTVYSVEDTVAIYCNTFDAISGVASSTCTTLTGLAYTFALETPLTHIATAADNAGNTITAMATFSVDVTYAGVGALVDRFVTKESSARSLRRKLDRAWEAELANDPDAKARNLDSFIDQLNRERDRTVAFDDAAILIQLVGLL